MEDENKLKIWDCKIGEIQNKHLPESSDSPMRRAVEEAYIKITGHEPLFNFSGWGGELTEVERAVVEHREPRCEHCGRGGEPI